MKTFTLLTIFIGLLGSASIAQEDLPKDDLRKKREKIEKLTPQEKADKRTDKMNEVLNLTDEQTTKINAINLEHATEMEAIKKEMKALKKKAKIRREATKKGIESVLDSEQNEKFKAEQEKHKLKRETKRRERCCRENE